MTSKTTRIEERLRLACHISQASFMAVPSCYVFQKSASLVGNIQGKCQKSCSAMFISEESP